MAGCPSPGTHLHEAEPGSGFHWLGNSSKFLLRFYLVPASFPSALFNDSVIASVAHASRWSTNSALSSLSEPVFLDISGLDFLFCQAHGVLTFFQDTEICGCPTFIGDSALWRCIRQIYLVWNTCDPSFLRPILFSHFFFGQSFSRIKFQV